jgi:uncharacterized membrane protein YciS (DUF1049 family)
VVVVALVLLIVVVLLVLAAVFGGTDPTTIDFGSFNLNITAAGAFFLGAGTLLALVVSLGLMRTAARRARARRADRKRVSELSQKLDEYKRDENENADDRTEER